MEEQRFARLMEYFKNEDNNIDFMVVFFFPLPTTLHLTLSLSRSPAEPPNNNNNDELREIAVSTSWIASHTQPEVGLSSGSE